MDELEQMLALQAAAQEQLNSTMAGVAQMLSQFRTQLVLQNFTTDGAERIVLEWFATLLNVAAPDGDD